MLTEKQLEERVNYLGSSDAAAVLGLSRWSTPLRVWSEKTGNIPIQKRDSLAIKLGDRLESVVAELFTEKTGKQVEVAADTVYHPKYPFIAANLDRMVVGEDAILECKTAASWKQSEWKEDHIPQEYIIQVLHALAVTGKAKAYLCCLIGNQSVELREILRDERVQSEIIAKEVEFWQTYVVPRLMPFSVTKKDKDTLDLLFPMAEDGRVVQLGDTSNQLIEALQGFKEDRRNLDGLIDEHENRLRTFLGDAETGLTDLYRITWKNQPDVRLDGKKLKLEAPEVWAKYAKQGNKRVLKYKKREENEDE